MKPFFCLLLLLSAAQAAVPIIPRPQQLQEQPGAFELRPSGAKATRIVTEADAAESAAYLASQLKELTGSEFAVVSGTEGQVPEDAIFLTTRGGPEQAGVESYLLIVTPGGVVIRGHDSAGLFYGVQSLLQLVPSATNRLSIPCLRLQDSPRFPWRGLMLDVSRHFFSKGEVEQVLDAMAHYKLNRFHWHLADDQGWRIQIKKYPRLTEVGAWRTNIGFGLPAQAGQAYGPDGRYGGYYTPADIREVVAYAAARHITVVPEIEMPGHASAALMAYPQYSCTGGPFTTDLPGGIFNGVYCAGNDATFTFLQDVLQEVFALFPGKYIHVGGDEVLTNNWSQCAKCQARRQREGLPRDIDLEGYFIRRMEKFINGQGRTLIGWSEIREGGLAPSSVVMDWAGGAVESAQAGHDVIMSPLADCYFDHYQSEDHSTEPHAIGGFLPLRQVYAFEPLPAGLDPVSQRHILGAQANLWTEYIPSLRHVEYMLFPRLCALAEVVWSPKASRDWPSFEQRLQAQYPLLERWGVNYRHPSAAGQRSAGQ